MTLSPIKAHAWNARLAYHLLVRAGFGASSEQIDKALALGLDASIHSLLNPRLDGYAAPACADLTGVQVAYESLQTALSPEAKQAIHKELHEKFVLEMKDLVQWWMNRIILTPAPLLEKMTLFWHGHFATSAEKVRHAYTMWLQNETFRTYALGNFGNLLKAVSRDPAMLIWLDLAQSRKEEPNENFAREFLELFTLGEGHYTENDVKEAARAFTGYRVDELKRTFRFVPQQCDEGEKTFLGQTGFFDGDDIINLVLAQPQCAQFIAEKIWRFFAYEDPDRGLVAALGAELRNVHYELKPFLQILFQSQEFYSPRAVNTQIKSPVQLVIEALLTLPLTQPDANGYQTIFRQLGQIPFEPPNVKGWEGGKAWINTATLTYRYKLARQLVNGFGSQRPAIYVPNLLAAEHRPVTPPLPIETIVDGQDRAAPEQLIDKLGVRVFQGAMGPVLKKMFLNYLSQAPLPLNDESLRDLVTLMMITPDYQLT